MLNFYFLLWLGQRFGDGGLGLIAVYLYIITGVSLICTVGYPNILIKYIAINPDLFFARKILINKITYSLLFFSLLGVLSYFANIFEYFYIFNSETTYFIKSNIFLISLGCVLNIIASLISSFFSGLKKYILAQLFSLLTLPSLTIIIIQSIETIKSVNFNEIILIFIFLQVFLVTIFFGIYIFKFIKFNNTKIEHTFAENMYFYFNSLFAFIILWLPILFVALAFSPNDAGDYNIGNKLGRVSSIIMVTFTLVMQPHLAKAYDGGEIDKIYSIVRMYLINSLIIYLPIFFIMLSFPGFILGVFSQDFLDAADFLKIFLFIGLIEICCGYVGAIMTMARLERHLFFIHLFGVILQFILIFILYSNNPLWVAYTQLITITFINLAGVLTIYRKFNFVIILSLLSKRFRFN